MSVAGFGTKKPIKPLTPTRAARLKRVARRKAADGRNAFRVMAVTFTRGLRYPDGRVPTLQEQYDALEHAVAHREPPFDDPDAARHAKVPKAPSTLCRWLQAEAAARQAGRSFVDALADKPGRGPKRQRLPQVLVDEIDRLAGLANRSIRKVVKGAEQLAKKLKLERPTGHKVRLALNDLGHAFHRAAAQGGQAVRIDGVPHAAVPTDHPHQLWTTDTFDFPVLMRGYDASAEPGSAAEYFGVPCEGILVIENHSGCILSDYLCDPTGRKDDVDQDAPGGPRYSREDAYSRDKATAQEVLGALLSAALPDLAPDPLKPVAGRLPSVALRCDVKVQRQLRERLQAIGLAVPELEGNSPNQRGIVEAIIGGVKGRAATLPGARPLYAEATRSEAAVAKERVQRAPKKHRPRPTIPIAARDYPDIRMARRLLREVVDEYNHTPGENTPENPLGLSPFQRLRAGVRGPECAEPHGRPGTDAYRLMEPNSTVVDKKSIRHRGVQFAASPTLFAESADGGPVVGFGIGELVDYRVDPLLRGIFAQARHSRLGEHPVMFLGRLTDVSRASDAAAVAKGLKKLARDASGRVRKARGDTAEQDIGPDAVHRAAAAGTLAERERARKQGGLAKPNKPRAPREQAKAAPTAAKPRAGAGTGSGATKSRAVTKRAKGAAPRPGARDPQIALAFTPGTVEPEMGPGAPRAVTVAPRPDPRLDETPGADGRSADAPPPDTALAPTTAPAAAPRADSPFSNVASGTGLFGNAQLSTAKFGSAPASGAPPHPRPTVAPPPGFGTASRTRARPYCAGDPRARVRTLDVPTTRAEAGPRTDAPPSTSETAA